MARNALILWARIFVIVQMAGLELIVNTMSMNAHRRLARMATVQMALVITHAHALLVGLD